MIASACVSDLLIFVVLVVLSGVPCEFQVKATFNTQQFTLKARTESAVWNRTFNFFTSKLKGHIIVRVYDKKFFGKTDAVAAVIPLSDIRKTLPTPVEEWFHLKPEKSGGGNDSDDEVMTDKSPKIKLVLNYPFAKKKGMRTKAPNSARGKKKGNGSGLKPKDTSKRLSTGPKRSSSRHNSSKRNSSRRVKEEGTEGGGSPSSSTSKTPTTESSESSSVRDDSLSEDSESSSKGGGGKGASSSKSRRRKKKKEIQDVYAFGDVLGKGATSVVVKGTKIGSDEHFAIKIIKREEMEDDEIMSEIGSCGLLVFKCSVM